MAMDIHYLEVFCKCAEKGSFSEAAIALKIKQSTISTHIKTMESELSAKLFDRRKGRIYLTPAGEIFYQEGLQAIAGLKKALDSVRNFLARIEGPLYLGGSTIPATYILPEIISGFRKRYPEVFFHLSSGNTDGILDNIRLEKIELGAVGSLPDDKEFAYCTLDVDELLLAFSPAYFPEIGDSLSPSEVKKLPFIMREHGSGTRQLMETVFTKAKLSLDEVKVVAEMGSLEAVKMAVMTGLGVSLIPKVALEFERKANLLKAIHISDLHFSRNFYLVHLLAKTLSPAAQAFWNFAEDFTQKTNQVDLKA